MFNRRGQVSIFRLGIIGGIIGFLAIGAGIASFFIDQASRSGPLDVALYPNAEKWGETETSLSSRDVFYKVAGIDPATVAAYYQERMNQHYQNQEERCVRTPNQGEYPTSNLPNSIPYQFQCMFDRSGFRSTQYTRVTVYPGFPNADPVLDTEGYVVIQYEQVWQPQ